jgi:hypothetical protein
MKSFLMESAICPLILAGKRCTAIGIPIRSSSVPALPISAEESMRSNLLTAAALGSALVLGNADGNAQSLGGSATTVPGGAPIGHLQPRAQQFSPRSPTDQTEQQQMSIFDAQQQKLDDLLDKRLNICRC